MGILSRVQAASQGTLIIFRALGGLFGTFLDKIAGICRKCFDLYALAVI